MNFFDNSATFTNWFNTKIKVEKFNFIWTIENISNRHEQLGQSFKSSCVKFEKNYFETEWYLRMYPKGEKKDSEDYFSLYLHLNNSNRSEVDAKCSFYILNEMREKIIGSEAKIIHKFHIDKQGWGLRKFIKRDFLFDESNKLLSNDKLTILCEISIVCDTVNTIAYSSTASVDKPLPKITEDTRNMFNTSNFSDCTIKVDDINIPIHKFLLASRSDVFHAMFNNKYRESLLNIIEITDFNYKVVVEMLRYIYTDDSPNLRKMPKEILAIAEKYNLQGLKAMAEETLISSINIINVCEYLILSDMYSAESLKKNCIEFICMHTTHVVNTENWNKSVVKNPLLLGEIIKKLAGVIKSSASDAVMNE